MTNPSQRNRFNIDSFGAGVIQYAEMATTPAPARLRRTLTLWDLILYGIIVIQPTAPMSVFGVLSNRGQGHVVTTILIAMVAMLFTAISYGRMARAYPSAGSAFTYVGAEINPVARLRHRLEHGHGLHAQSADLHHLVQPSRRTSVGARSIPYLGALADLLCRGFYRAEFRGVQDLGAHQYRCLARAWAWSSSMFFCYRGPLHFRPFATAIRGFFTQPVL